MSPHCVSRPATPSRIESKVFRRDSRGTESTYLSISQPKPKGMDRLKLIDSHSTYTPPSSSLNRQYEFRRHRKPWSLPEFSTSLIRVATLRLEARVGLRRWYVTEWLVS